MLDRRIEEVSLNSWPALQHLLYDGWIVRFAKGFTKRANSVNVVYESRLDVTEKVAVCERLYHERGLPPVFRLTSFAPGADLERVLDDRRYQQIDRSSVQHLDLHDCAIPREQSLELRDEPLDEWMALHGRLDPYPEEQQAVHKEMGDDAHLCNFLPRVSIRQGKPRSSRSGANWASPFVVSI